MNIARPSRETIGERTTTHGHMRGGPSPTYRSWRAMVARCTNPNFPAFLHYGAQGVAITERWLKFENFLADMGERPSLKHTLDRYPDNAGNYEPGNCRWATRREQRLNQKRIRAVTRSDGLRFNSIIEAAEATGANRRCIRDACTGRQSVHRGFGWRFAE